MGFLFLDCLEDLGSQADPSGSRWTIRRDFQRDGVVAALQHQVQGIEMMVVLQYQVCIVPDTTYCFLVITALIVFLTFV